eukprot:167446-Pyramimonas_sp.AAC.1
MLPVSDWPIVGIRGAWCAGRGGAVNGIRVGRTHHVCRVRADLHRHPQAERQACGQQPAQLTMLTTISSSQLLAMDDRRAITRAYGRPARCE